MASVVFFEKPGCATNARQKRMLEAAGHSLVVRSLLAEPWTAERLLAFFAGTPVAAWFNRAAPRVKSGAVDPEHIDAKSAIGLMLAEPLLIRRPLIETDAGRCAGFDREPVLSLLGGGQTPRNDAGDPNATLEARGLPHDLESCSRSTTAQTARQ